MCAEPGCADGAEDIGAGVQDVDQIAGVKLLDGSSRGKASSNPAAL